MLQLEIICTGDEILTGKTVNTNFSYMARRLGEVGLEVSRGTIVGDNRESLSNAFLQASKRADVVIVNGGLGPTVDDLSQEVAAEVAGVELELNEAWFEQIQKYFSRRGREMPSSNRKQAMLPVGSEVIDNPVGTACGFALAINDARFFFTPGVPREMKRMVDDQIIPRLREMSGLHLVFGLKRFHSFGIGESRADVLLQAVAAEAAAGSVKLGFQSHYPQLETKLSVQGNNEEEVRQALAPVEAVVRQRLGNFVVAEDRQTLEGRIMDAMRNSGWTLSTMEMFTGGGIAARLLPLEGSDRLIKRCVASRDLSQLIDAAGITARDSTAVMNCETAVALAKGLGMQSGASHALVALISLAASSRQPGELSGDIFIAIAHEGSSVYRQARFSGGADWIRLGAMEMALDVMRRYIYGLPIDERIDFEEGGQHP